MPFVLGDPTQTSPEIHVGDVGTQFIITIYNQDSQVQNLAPAVSLMIKFTSPERESTEKEASLYTDGSDGKLIYTLEEGDIDIAGSWNYQVVLEFSTGTWSTNIESFTVYSNIVIPIP